MWFRIVFNEAPPQKQKMDSTYMAAIHVDYFVGCMDLKGGAASS